ncbi:MAG: restriction endonuclease subunit S [Gallionella sp.]|nr:restriction endonuclease subunit S [Gallionella sp.]
MSDVSGIPKGWCRTSLEKIASWGSGGTPSRNIEKYFQGTIPWVKTGELEGKYLRETEEHISEEALKNSSAKIFPKGSVGVAMYGATIGKLSIFGIEASTNQACAVGIPTDAINNEFLYYYLLSERRSLIKAGKGGAQPNLSQGVIKEWPINLPPLCEQHRIVAKIEELFSELDKGIENLKTAQVQLKVYRQAQLKHAFEGKLTAQWRAENQDKLETADALLKRIQQERAARYQQQLADWQVNGGTKPKAPKYLPPLTAEERAELPELPEGWGWCKLGNFIDSIDAGKSFKCDEREPRANEIGVAKVSAVTWGEYDESESKTCTDSSKENEAYLIQSGDFILSRANTIDLVGACVIARKVTKKIMLSDKTLRIRFDGFSQEYFLQYLGSRIGRKQIMLLSTGNQESMRNIGQERIRSITVPICSVVEADAVIESLAARLSEVDQLELTITTSLQQSEALRQSILKKAFSGQLVPQDPHDESASALLARIKAERAKSPQPPFAKGGRSRSGGEIHMTKET